VARKRPTASDDRPHLVCIDGDRPDGAARLLTMAEAHALRRSEALTHSQLKAHLTPVQRTRPQAN
jgi:hypothetical protein